MNLENLGWDENFYSEYTLQEGLEAARVTAVHKDKYSIRTGTAEFQAEITGKLMFSAESPLDYPATGDWVAVQIFDEGSVAIIHEILPRKTEIKRKASGKKIEYQLIAANVDTAFLMQALDSNYNLRRLERYLVLAHETGVTPVVLLSKSDLISQEEIQQKTIEIKTLAEDIQVIPFSNVSKKGLSDIVSKLEVGMTYCVLGSSGIGKTTLINSLLGEDQYDTKAIREKDGRGRHTTTSRQMIVLDNGAMLIDTPGMRELGSISLDSGLDETFDEIAEAEKNCRFSDCTHTNEAGCGVLEAVNAGDISSERYNNYMKMRRESEHHERSYLEKRKRDKAFGKMYKSVLKNNIKYNK